MNLPSFSACLLSVFILLASAPAIAQQEPAAPQANATDEDEAKKAREEFQKKTLAFLEQLISDSASFSLPENRIFVQAKAVELLWKHDETRARNLAREVMSQIAAINSEITQESEQNINSSNQLFQRVTLRSGNVANLRSQLLSFLSSVDSKLALEFLRTTRRPPLSLDNRMSTDDNQEKYLEYELAARVSGSDPQMSFQMAEELLKNGPNYQIFSILNNLSSKDPQLAARLATDAVEKIKSTDLLASYDNVNFTTQMLQYLKHQMTQATNAQNATAGSQQASLPMPNSQQAYRDILNSYVGAALKLTSKSMLSQQEAEKGRNLLRNIKGYLPEVETYLPSRAAALRAKLNEFDDALYYSPQEKYFQEYNQKMQNKSAQELMTMAPTAPQEVRENIYQQAIYKALEQGDKETARKIARENLANKSFAEQIIANNERQTAERAANEGKYDEALSQLAKFGLEQDRANTLARWASTALNKGDEKMARQLLEEARGLVAGKMQTRQELDAQISIAGSYLKLEPNVSFELTERAIERLNEVIAAQLELASFNGGREGEAFLGSGDISYIYSGNLNYLGPELMRKDFDRAVSLFDRWQMKETRIMVSLGVLQSLLSNQSAVQYQRAYRATMGQPQIIQIHN
jgi:hypothetical protein